MTTKYIGIEKVKEECAELIVILSKLSAYPTGRHPSTKLPEHLRVYIEDELGDVLGAIGFFLSANADDIDAEKVGERAGMKLKKLHEWNNNGDGMVGLEVPEEH